MRPAPLRAFRMAVLGLLAVVLSSRPREANGQADVLAQSTMTRCFATGAPANETLECKEKMVLLINVKVHCAAPAIYWGGPRGPWPRLM